MDTPQTPKRKPGRPLGSKTGQQAATITANAAKAEAREALRQIVLEHMRPMVEAQIAHSKGIKFLVARSSKGGKFERVTEDQLDKILSGQDDGSVTIEVWDKDPSVQAFTDLMNRALDKPSEHLELTGADGGPVELVSRLAAARKRLADQT